MVFRKSMGIAIEENMIQTPSPPHLGREAIVPGEWENWGSPGEVSGEMTGAEPHRQRKD